MKNDDWHQIAYHRTEKVTLLRVLRRMDKASKALRRSSVCIKSMGMGHRDLNMVISELKAVRSTAKAFIVAQNTAVMELMKWASGDENEAIKNTFIYIAELNSLWTEVQKEFSENLKEFSHQFEMILEGEQHMDQVRNRLSVCENKEQKIRKEIQKSARKSTPEELQQLEAKLVQAKQSKELAQYEAMECMKEKEAVKLIRIKEGMLKLSESYLELAHKCHVIFEAQRDVASEIPDVQDQNIHEITYTGNEAARQSVTRAKEQVQRYQRRSYHLLPRAPPLMDDCGPPPPYSPVLSQEVHRHSHGSDRTNLHHRSHTGGYPDRRLTDQRYSVGSLSGTDVRWNQNYEEELAGAVSRFRIGE
ncbi:uncharacterized protein LOC126248692 [Schistocerca nitens]|uniref:uncharacterized protein LOC126248692 n=1 Tax=Schistocerca nitens TaxID=7011 RepID=UPI0021173051|nr:uncharacterized protein LOC126248692 [Schistocerca nitens]